MNPTLYNGLILAGVFQGLIFGCTILISPKYKTRSSQYLALLILSFSLGTLQFTLEESGVITHDQLFEYIHIPWSVLIAPFLYFYFITFINPKKTFTNLEKSLYLPFLLMTLVSMAFKVLSDIDPSDPRITEPLYQLPMLGNYYGDLLNSLFILFIIVVLFRKISSYQATTTVYNPQQLIVKLNWLKATLFILLFLIAILAYTTIEYENDVSVIFFPIYLGVAITIYWLGYIGIYKSNIIEERKKIRSTISQNLDYSIVEKRKNQHIDVLANLMEHKKQFLDSNVSLEGIADQLQLSKGHLSRIINSQLGVSFSDYVNSLRVAEAMLYLKNPEFSKYTLVAIGLEAGFNSKSAFNTAFKKHTGLTPSQYKNAT